MLKHRNRSLEREIYEKLNNIIIIYVYNACIIHIYMTNTITNFELSIILVDQKSSFRHDLTYSIRCNPKEVKMGVNILNVK